MIQVVLGYNYIPEHKTTFENTVLAKKAKESFRPNQSPIRRYSLHGQPGNVQVWFDEGES